MTVDNDREWLVGKVLQKSGRGLSLRIILDFRKTARKLVKKADVGIRETCLVKGHSAAAAQKFSVIFNCRGWEEL
jgi:hypothetical protein